MDKLICNSLLYGLFVTASFFRNLYISISLLIYLITKEKLKCTIKLLQKKLKKTS